MSTPTNFPRYVNLPVELQRNIVQEAAEDIEWKFSMGTKSAAYTYTKNLGQYACIDRVWQDIIERDNFKHLRITSREIKQFEEICGKRQGILHKIRCSIFPDETGLTWGQVLSGLEPSDVSAMFNKAVYRTLEALFNVMKDWRTTERRRRNLISVDICLVRAYYPFKEPIHYDFSGLPTVRVIGNLFSRHFPFFHPSSAISIYKKLPNLEVVHLQLEVQPTVPSVNQEAIDAIQSLRELSSTPSKIKLVAYRIHTNPPIYTRRRNAREELPILKCLTRSCPPWSNTMTRLDLQCLNNVPDFLKGAQTVLWPRLEILKLGGSFDSIPAGSRKETGSRIVHLLTSMLSKMPSIITVNIDVDPIVGWKGMTIDMYLGPDPDSEGLYTRAGLRLPFVPDREDCVANLCRVSIPGYLVVLLQDVAWRHQGRKLAVFCTPEPMVPSDYHFFGVPDNSDPDDGWSWGTNVQALFGKYKQWNQEKKDWDRFESLPNSVGSGRHWELVEDSDEPETGVS